MHVQCATCLYIYICVCFALFNKVEGCKISMYGKCSQHEESLQLECHHVAGLTWWLRGSDDRSNALKQSARRAGGQSLAV